jgi:hypothetical protein
VSRPGRDTLTNKANYVKVVRMSSLQLQRPDMVETSGQVGSAVVKSIKKSGSPRIFNAGEAISLSLDEVVGGYRLNVESSFRKEWDFLFPNETFSEGLLLGKVNAEVSHYRNALVKEIKKEMLRSEGYYFFGDFMVHKTMVRLWVVLLSLFVLLPASLLAFFAASDVLFWLGSLGVLSSIVLPVWAYLKARD